LKAQTRCYKVLVLRNPVQNWECFAAPVFPFYLFWKKQKVIGKSTCNVIGIDIDTVKGAVMLLELILVQ
jgi:hypothetical protein